MAKLYLFGMVREFDYMKKLVITLNTLFFFFSAPLVVLATNQAVKDESSYLVILAISCFIPILLILNIYSIWRIETPKIIYKDHPKVQEKIIVKETIKYIKPAQPDNILFKILRILSIFASIIFILISSVMFNNLRYPEPIAAWAIFILIICLVVIIVGRDGTGFLSLYFKRKKLEQISRIKELEEKIK